MILNLYHDAQIKATREFFEHFLLKVKLSSRANLIQFAGKQLESVIIETSKIRDSLTEQMEKDYARIEQIRVPSLRARREQDLEKDITRSFELIEQLLDDFRKAANAQLQQ